MVKTRWSAFTLVELLVVIGIITVLIGVLLPALSKARAQAQAVQCMSNLRQWGMGLQMYVDSSKGQLPQKGPNGTDATTDYIGPYPSVTNNTNGVIGVNDPSLWYNAIPPFINKESYYDLLVQAQPGASAVVIPPPHTGDGSFWTCPAQLAPGSNDLGTGGDTISGDYFVLDGTDSYGILKNSTGNKAATTFVLDYTYGFNSKLTTNSAQATNTPAIKMSSLTPTSEVVILVEKMMNAGEYKDGTVQNYVNGTPGNQYSVKSPPWINSAGWTQNVAQSNAIWTRFTTRHNHGGNILFADGHVAWFAWTDIQIPTSQLPYVSSGPVANQSNANQASKVIWCPTGPTN